MNHYLLSSVLVSPDGEPLLPEEEVGAVLRFSAEQLHDAMQRRAARTTAQARRYALWGALITVAAAALVARLASQSGRSAWLPWIALIAVLLLGQVLLFYRIRLLNMARHAQPTHAAITKIHRLYWPIDLTTVDKESVIVADPASQSETALAVTPLPPLSTVSEAGRDEGDGVGMVPVLQRLLQHEARLDPPTLRTSWQPVAPSAALATELSQLWRKSEADRSDGRAVVQPMDATPWTQRLADGETLRQFAAQAPTFAAQIHLLQRQSHDLADEARKAVVASQERVQKEIQRAQQCHFAPPQDEGEPLALTPKSALPMTAQMGRNEVRQRLAEVVAQLGEIEAETSERFRQIDTQEARALAALGPRFAPRRAALQARQQRLIALADESYAVLESLNRQQQALMSAATQLEESSHQLASEQLTTLQDNVSALAAQLEVGVSRLEGAQQRFDATPLIAALSETREAVAHAASTWRRLLREMPRQQEKVMDRAVVVERHADALLGSGSIHPAAQSALDTDRFVLQTAAQRMDDWVARSAEPSRALQRLSHELSEQLNQLARHSRLFEESRTLFAQLAGMNDPTVISLNDVAGAILVAIERLVDNNDRYQQAATALRTEAARSHEQRDEATRLLDEWAAFQREWLAEEQALEQEEAEAEAALRASWQAQRDAIGAPQRRFESIAAMVEQRLNDLPEAVARGLIQDETTLGWLDRLVGVIDEAVEGWGARIAVDSPTQASQITALQRRVAAQYDALAAHCMTVPIDVEGGAVRCLLPFYYVEQQHSARAQRRRTMLIPPASIGSGSAGERLTLGQLRYASLTDRLKQYIDGQDQRLPVDAEVNLSQTLLQSALRQQLQRVGDGNGAVAQLLRNSERHLLDNPDWATITS